MTMTLDGSASVTINSGAVLGVTSGTAVASTSGTSITFSSIPSWVKRITVNLQGISTSGTSPPQIQIGSGSVTTSGYLGSNGTLGATNATANFTAGFGIGVNTSNWGGSVIGHGSIFLSLLNSSTYTWVASGCVARSDAAQINTTAGSVSLSGVLDRIVITNANGTDTFDAGSVNILYEG